MSAAHRLLVADTGPLRQLHEAGALLLVPLLGETWVPPAVMAGAAPVNSGKTDNACVLDCGGRAKRRHRFASLCSAAVPTTESGVALRFPPQSKTSRNQATRTSQFGSRALFLEIPR